MNVTYPVKFEARDPGADAPDPSRGPAPQPATAPQASPPLLRDDVVVLLLAVFRPDAYAWGWSRFVLGKQPLAGLSRLRFSKVLGSGFEGGFGLKPSIDRHGLFLVFDGEAAADAFLADSAVLQGYRRHTVELLTAKLRVTSTRGSWSGFQLGVSAEPPTSGPLAVLTRASIRPGKAARFWPLAPASQTSLETAPGCRLAVGLGEAPVLRQATFSVWDSVPLMDAYARSGAHQTAIKTSYAGDFFSESMFTRFRPLRIEGVWKGVRHG